MTKVLFLLIKLLSGIFFLLGKIFSWLKKPLTIIQNTIFKIIVLPLFGRYIWLKNKFNKKTNSLPDKILLVFTNRYIVHLLIIILTFGVTASNILAYETKEDYGRGALIYKIANFENLGSIEDTVTFIEEPQISSYLESSSQLTSEVVSESQRREVNISQQQESDLVITQGGSALIKPELVSTEAAKITRTSVRDYTIAEGDTIGKIASDFGVSVNTILWANNLSYYSYIRPGQKIIIPPTSGVLHKISSGDTISKIASKYRTSSAEIKRFNNIKDSDALAVGETIMVPGGRIIYTPRPRSYSAPATAPAYSAPIVASGGKMYWPSDCRRITQYYRGWRHTGLDIACGWGKPIRVAESGTISKVRYNKYGYGYHVIVNHGNGKQTLYAHLSRILVKTGQKVKKAEVIALEGSTGHSTGSHLHFEVRINGQRLNPLNYIR